MCGLIIYRRDYRGGLGRHVFVANLQQHSKAETFVTPPQIAIVIMGARQNDIAQNERLDI